MTEKGAYCVEGRRQIFLLIFKAGLIDPSSLELSCTLLVGWFPGDPTPVCWECTCRCKVVYHTEFPGGSKQWNVWLYPTRPFTGLCRIIEQWPSECWSWRIWEAGKLDFSVTQTWYYRLGSSLRASYMSPYWKTGEARVWCPETVAAVIEPSFR